MSQNYFAIGEKAIGEKAIGEKAIKLLEQAGYAVHRGFDEEHPHLGHRAVWFTWAHPSGKGDIEVGTTYKSFTQAWIGAMEHYFSNTEMTMHVL
jgi:hypothetical protein